LTLLLPTFGIVEDGLVGLVFTCAPNFHKYLGGLAQVETTREQIGTFWKKAKEKK
jgi:hypothetical protein